MPLPTAPLSKSVSPSSRAWLASHFRDPYVKARLSHPEFRSRSAFKLIEMHQQYGNFLTRNVNTVVDLGAAPGGWSQVVAGKMGWTTEAEMETLGLRRWGVKGKDRTHRKAGLRPNDGEEKQQDSWSGPAAEGKTRDAYEMLYGTESEQPQRGRGTIVAADLLYIPPIPGVRTLQIDFLSPEAGNLIRAMLMSPSNPKGKADLILSDMAANFTGNQARDTEASLDICLAVYQFVKTNLRTVQETGKKYSGTLLYVTSLFLLSPFFVICVLIRL
jgi:23S rRNA (uridine2552-2'-O)-methyltransferase